MSITDLLKDSSHRLLPESYAGEEALEASLIDDELTPVLLDAPAVERELGLEEIEEEALALAAGVVPVSNTAILPYRLTAMLAIRGPDPDGGWFRGSAFLVAPHTLLTAGHNVFFTEVAKYASRIRVYPGRNGNTSFGIHEVTGVHVVDGWRLNGDVNFDFAAIKVNEPIGNSLGWFGILANEGSFNDAVVITGYPSEENDFSMWEGQGTGVPETATRLRYDVKTRPGQSGGSVFLPQTLGAVAVHTHLRPSGASGVRFVPPIKDVIDSWRT